MTDDERALLEGIRDRLSDHLRECKDAHERIESMVIRITSEIRAEVIRISEKVNNVCNEQAQQKGGQSAGRWMIATGIAIGAALTGIAGLIANIIIQIELHK